MGKSPRLADETDLPVLQKFAKQTATDQIMQMIDRSLEADLQNDRNVQLVLIIEALVDSLSSVSGSAA